MCFFGSRRREAPCFFIFIFILFFMLCSCCVVSLQSWDIVFAGYRLALPGFLPGAVNSVQIGNPSAFAPDFLRVGVAA